MPEIVKQTFEEKVITTGVLYLIGQIISFPISILFRLFEYLERKENKTTKEKLTGIYYAAPDNYARKCKDKSEFIYKYWLSRKDREQILCRF